MGVDTWDSAPGATEGDGWKPDVAVTNRGWVADAGDEDNFTGDFNEANISKHADGDGPADGGCRICGEDGHFARDCPDRKENTGECYNCGEQGHNKAECPNPRVEREFTGNCRICNEVGHRAADCPQKPPSICKICDQEGHDAKECTKNRVFTYRPELKNLSAEQMNMQRAWEALEEADKEKDVEDIKLAILQYAKAYNELTFEELEGVFREANMKTHLIAMEKPISDTQTIVNLQGEKDQKFAISIQFSAQPRRAKFAELWPSSAEENMTRLPEAGFIMDGMVDKCRNCEQIGHLTKNCPEDKVEKEKPKVTCAVCNEEGHYARDCTQERKKGGKECRNCGETGHISKDCPNKEPEMCRNCGQEGHRAKECDIVKCRNCDGEGHKAAECPEPKNMAKVQCRNCDEFGHTSRDCPKPRDWSRFECRNCGEKGHGVKRCPMPLKEHDGGDGGFGGEGGFGGDGGGASGGGDAWGAGGGAQDSGAGRWGGDDAGASGW